MPSGSAAETIREASDPIEEIGERGARRRNHIQMAVITPACLRASAAEEAGKPTLVILSAAKDLPPATDSVTAVLI